MEQGEIETLVADLETRIDRLRALYDQYFMGIERLEPSVARKDVERKIQVLRKEQIRNTGVRFRFQQLLHRYGTFQQHWHRITRQIENGTFRRHVLRAKSMFGTPAAGHPSRGSAHTKAAVSSDDVDVDLDVEVEFSADPVGSWSPPIGIPAVDDTPTDPHLRAADPVDHLDEWGDPPTQVRSQLSAPGAPPTPPRAVVTAVQPAVPPRTTLRSPTTFDPAPAPPSPKPPKMPTGSFAAVKTPTGAFAAVAPPRPSSLPRPPAGGVTPTLVPGRRQVSPPAAVLPAPPGTRPMVPTPPATKPGMPAPPPTPSSAKSLPPAAGSAPRVGPSHDRVRALYSELVETKRKLKESTAAITFDGLAKNLEESSAKLRAKHGRDVDFEVTVRDGKAMIKPVFK